MDFDSTYYRTNYRDYEKQNPTRKLRYYVRLIESHTVAPDSPRRIHDIGCGFGSFLSCLDTTWKVCGSDPSEFAIDRAKKVVPNGDFKVATASGDTASDTPLFPGQFAVVTAWDVLEHVPDLDACAAAIKRQLVDGGLFAFVVPVYDGLCGPLVRVLDRDQTHLHKWRRRQWVEWANNHFTVVKWSGTLRYLLPLFGYYLHLPTKRFRNHTPALTVICQKVSC